MSLIQCPECSKEISDKVKACPHCGYPFEETGSTQYNANVPEGNAHLESQASAKEKKHIKLSKKNLIIIIAAVVAVIAIILIAVKISANSNRSKYIENLKAASITMLTGAAQSEEVCNLTQSVWHNTIYEEEDPNTDEYTKGNYSWGNPFHSDFNTSLTALYSDNETISKVNDIESNRDSVEMIMKLLVNPPKDLEMCFEITNDMYSAYYNLTDLAISPSGSLTTFSDDFSEYDNTFIELYDKLELYIPENSEQDKNE